MMTPEKPTMADMSGGKRDRISDHTDKPVTTPNTRDTKLLCSDDKAAIGRQKDGKLVEKEHILDSAPIKVDDNGVTVALFVKPDQKDVIDVDDLDSLLASGGLEDSPGSDTDEHVPKTLFDTQMDESVLTETVVSPSNDDTSLATIPSTGKNKLLDNSIHISTEKTNNNHKNNKNNETEQKQQNQASILPTNLAEPPANKNAILILNDGFKPTTQMWKDVDSRTKEIVGLAYTKSDRDTKLLLNRSSVLLHFQLSDDKEISRDKWVKMFIELPKLQGRNFKFLKRFGIALALTNPTEIFSPEQFDGKTLIRGPISNAWAGAYTVYGAGWKPDIGLDISGGISSPTKWWKDLSPQATVNISPFLPSEIFSDHSGSMHDQEKHFRKVIGIKPQVKIVPIKDWILGLKSRYKDQPSVQKILIKLALTPITIFDPSLFADQKKKTKLNSLSVTNFWISAYRIAGAPWNLKAPPAPVSNTSNPFSGTTPIIPPTATPSPPKSSKVQFQSPVKKAPGLFLSRAARQPTVTPKLKAETRKYDDIYYTVETPPLDSDWREAGPEITAYFNNIKEHIHDSDKKALIHIWNGRSGQILTKKSEPLTNKIQVKKYASQLFLRQGFPVIFRLRISHDVNPRKLIANNHSDGLHIKQDHIQERDLTIIGFLVGSSPSAANLDDMQEAHEHHPILSGLKILATVQAIKLASGKNMIPWDQQVKAVHIQVGESQAISARDIYNQVYGSRNIGGYPQGINMRFVPDISDARFPVTKSTKIKAIKMLSKQKAFLENTKQISTNTIAGIHLLNDEIGFTLAQVLMSIKSFDYPELGLFIAIDEEMTAGAYSVIFTVHLDRFNEANSLVPLLCILLEAKFGKSIWDWFTDDAKRVLPKYRWHKEEECVVPIHPDQEDDGQGFDSDDEYMKSICNLFDLDDNQDDGNGFDFDLAFVVEEELKPKNQYGDSGSVKTFRHDLPQADSSAMSDAPSFSADLTPATFSTHPAPSVNDTKLSLETLILSNPSLAQTILSTISNSAVSPTEGVDGR